MIRLLRKIFIKNYDDVSDAKVRSAHGVLAAIGGIFVNILLFTAKLLIGIFTFSLSIISDAINNLTDLMSCIVNLLGFKISAAPADREHPFGHQRSEYISGMIVSFIIIAAAVVLGYSSISSLLSADAVVVYTVASFIVLAISIAAKTALGLFYYSLGKTIDSVALKAARQDSFGDAVATTAVLVAALVQFFAPQTWWLDGAMSLAVALFILWTGIKMTRETAAPLMGEAADKSFVDKIVSDILAYDGVLGVHDVICHSYGPTKLFMTLHVEVDGYADVFSSHTLIDRIENEIGAKYRMLLTIHMDPLDTRNERLPIIGACVGDVLRCIDAQLSYHDLRLVTCDDHTNVIFDVVCPAGLMPADKLKSLITQKLSTADNTLVPVITVDSRFVK